MPEITVNVPLTGPEVSRLMYWSSLNDKECERLRGLGATIDKTDADALTAKLKRVDDFFEKLPR